MLVVKDGKLFAIEGWTKREGSPSIEKLNNLEGKQTNSMNKNFVSYCSLNYFIWKLVYIMTTATQFTN